MHTPETMRSEPITSDRLRLIPVTIETCTAELEKSSMLSEMIDAIIPGSWPPPLLTEETLHEFIALLSHPDGERLCAWYWILRPDEPGGKGILIGSGGLFMSEDTSCEIGYSVLEEYQCNGFATEAVKEILVYLSSTVDNETIFATTYPGLTPSVRVLEKCGFEWIGAGKDEGTIRFRYRVRKVVQ